LILAKWDGMLRCTKDGEGRVLMRSIGASHMIQLVLIFCQLANGGSCIEQRPMLDDIGGPMGCMIAAQPLAADFIRGHPAFRLASWRCEIGKPPEKAASILDGGRARS
jgi:hypothetical protein